MSIEFVIIESFDKVLKTRRKWIKKFIDKNVLIDYNSYKDGGDDDGIRTSLSNISDTLRGIFKREQDEIIENIEKYKLAVGGRGDSATLASLENFKTLVNTKKHTLPNLLTILYNIDITEKNSFFSRLEPIKRSWMMRVEPEVPQDPIEIEVINPPPVPTKRQTIILPGSSDDQSGTKAIVLIILAIIAVLSGILIIPILVVFGYLLYRTAVLPANRRWTLGKILKNAALWPLNLRGIAAY